MDVAAHDEDAADELVELKGVNMWISGSRLLSLEAKLYALEATVNRMTVASSGPSLREISDNVMLRLTPMIEQQDSAIEAIHEETKPLRQIQSLIRWATKSETQEGP